MKKINRKSKTHKRLAAHYGKYMAKMLMIGVAK